MNALEKVVDLLMAVILMFLIPLLYYGGGMCVSKTILAEQAGENFLRRITTEGEITLPVWMELEKSLERCGGVGVQLQWERTLYEPAKETGEVMRSVYTKQKEALLEEIKEEGKFCLIKGDKIRLTLEVDGIPGVYCISVRTGATEI